MTRAQLNTVAVIALVAVLFVAWLWWGFPEDVSALWAKVTR